MRNVVRIFLFLTAALSLGGCIEKFELAYDQIQVKGADGNVNLVVEPLEGQGYRLSASAENLCGNLQEAGFHIEQSISASTHYKTWRIPVQDISNFSAIVTTQELLARQVWAYAYVICDSIEVQSQPIELRLGADVLPDPMPVVDHVELGELQENHWDGRYYQVRVVGKNFVPFDKYDYKDPLFRSGYLKAIADDRVKLNILSATQEQLRVQMTLSRYCYNESFTWCQGQKKVVVDGIRIDAPNWVLPPSHSYRMGETFVPEFATEVGKDQIKLHDDANYLSYGTTFTLDPLDLRTYTFSQHYSHIPIHGHNITIPISYPWQLIEGKTGYTRNDRERICSGHCVFIAGMYDKLCWFDGETLQEYSATVPWDAWIDHIASSDDPESVVIVNVGRMNDKHDIYRFRMADKKMQYLGSTPKEAGYVYLVYEREGMLYEVIGKGSNCQLVRTDLATMQTSSEAINLEASGIDRFAGEYKGVIYYSCGHRQYAYDTTTHTVRQLNNLKANTTASMFYTAISGHWLYNGDEPIVRYDLDQPNPEPEFLGCPKNGYFTCWTYPMGDDCYAANYEYISGKDVHRLYRFVDDRK